MLMIFLDILAPFRTCFMKQSKYAPVPSRIDAFLCLFPNFFSHNQYMLTQGLFVQHGIAIASIVARVKYFLEKTLAEIPTQQLFSLDYLSDSEEKEVLIKKYDIKLERPDSIDDGILVSEDVKAPKRPAPQSFNKKKKKPYKATGSNEIDDIFG